MSLLQDWLPPSPGNWTSIVTTFTYFPVITAVQWLTAYYPMGKTSTTSCLNVPGKLAWMLMELPAPFLLVYTMTGLRATLPPPPKENLILAGIYVTHYIYRALLAPILNPSMSPIHPILILGAWVFNAFNAISIGGHLAGLGPTLTTRFALGLPLWALGFAGTIRHDEILRRGRRAASKPGAPAKAQNTHTVPDGHGGKKTGIDYVAEGDSNEEVPPVTPSTRLLFPGPTPNTVTLPAAICVRPASQTTSATNPAAFALAASSSIPASLLICTAILAWPPRSQARRYGLVRREDL
ncbi:hypothetical protein V490_07297 [Pseudogymnoascus sp. VKM F-3557]|nr:hypothetical protein V490_07297 [Pseudogymnoascus sp. VKM F-3557]